MSEEFVWISPTPGVELPEGATGAGVVLTIAQLRSIAWWVEREPEDALVRIHVARDGSRAKAYRGSDATDAVYLSPQGRWE